MALSFYDPIRNTAHFAERIHLGVTTESLTLDFKLDLGKLKAPTKEKKEGWMEFCRDVCQFANSIGGSLLIGIEEIKAGAQRVAGSVRPLDDFDFRKEWMEKAVEKHLHPATTRIFIDPVDTSAGLVISVNVPPSERVVSVWDRENGTIEFLRRTNHGKVRMTPDELEAALMDRTRRVTLALHRIRQTVPTGVAEIASGVWDYDPYRGSTSYVRPWPFRAERTLPTEVKLTNVGEHDFVLHVTIVGLGTRILRVPFGLLREVWLTSDDRIAFFLDAKVVVEEQGRITLEPLVQ